MHDSQIFEFFSQKCFQKMLFGSEISAAPPAGSPTIKKRISMLSNQIFELEDKWSFNFFKILFGSEISAAPSAGSPTIKKG